MSDETAVLRTHVQASAALLGIPMDAERTERVLQHFARTARMAALLDALPLAPEDEPAELFCPAPFPQVGR